MTVLAQVFGFGALASSVIIYSRKTKRNLLIFKAVQDVCWCIHYLLLSCYSAAATSAICVTRSMVFCNPKMGKNKLWLGAYLLFYAVSAALTWQNGYSLLPALASCVSAVAFYLPKPHQTKAVQIVASCITLSYNILQSHSLSVYLGVTLTVTTAAISLCQYAAQKKKK